VSCKRVHGHRDYNLLRMVEELSFLFPDPFHLAGRHVASVAASFLLGQNLSLAAAIHGPEPSAPGNAVVECPYVAEMDVLNVGVFDGVRVVECQCTTFSYQIKSSHHSSVFDDHPCEEEIVVFRGVEGYVTCDGSPRHLFPYRPSHPSLHLLCSESPLDHDVHTVQPMVSIPVLNAGLCGDTWVYRKRTSFMSLLANSYSFLFPAKTMTATSARQSTASSNAFLKSPFFRLRNVTYTRISMSIRWQR